MIASLVMDDAPVVIDILALACVTLLVVAFVLCARLVRATTQPGDRQPPHGGPSTFRPAAPVVPLDLGRERRRQVDRRRNSRRAAA